MITQAAAERFAEDGFLVERGVFEPSELECYRRAVDTAVAGRPEQPAPVSERDEFDRMFTQYFNLWEDSPEVRPLSFDRRLAERASILLGGARIRLYCDQVFYKEAGCSATAVHQDYPFFSIKEARTLSVWIPLGSATRENGTLGYLLGSHRLGAESHVDRLMGRNLMQDQAFAEALQHPTFVELAPGDVVFHHVLTFHLSMPNLSPQTRRAFVITYFEDGCTRGTSWPHATVDRMGLLVGERIEGPAAPVVWPAPARLPDPPSPNPEPPRGWPGRAPAPAAEMFS